MHHIIYCLAMALFAFSPLAPVWGDIAKVDDIQPVKAEIDAGTLVLFNVAEVLIDTEMSLGTQAWRKFLRARVDAKTHDEITLFVFEHVPPAAVQAEIPALIRELQAAGIDTLAFTSRGRNEWYSSQAADVDTLTEKLLKQIGIDFSCTRLTGALAALPEYFDGYFHEGIIYSGNTRDKGELLLDILTTTGYRPAKIVFVDDKADSLVSVQTAIHQLGIPFFGFAYGRTAQVHADFDPMVANIQLDALITTGVLLSDAEAAEIARTQYAEADPAEFLEAIVQKWKARQQ